MSPDRSDRAGVFARLSANYVETFRQLARCVKGGEVIERGGVSLVATGLPLAPFNVAFLRGRLADTEGELARTVAWFRSCGLPFLVRSCGPADSATEEAAASIGLVDAPAPPGMAMSNSVLSPAPAADLEIVQANDERTMQHHAHVCARGFAIAADAAARLLPPALLGLHDVEVFVGYLDGMPVASSALFFNNGVAGVYNVATVEGQRRKGLGAAMTWHAVRRGRELGCSFSGLMSSVMGQPMYEGTGFSVIATYPSFGARPPDTARPEGDR